MQLSNNGTVLIMDDDTILCDLMTAMLHELGYRTCLVESGEEVIEQYMRSKASADPFAVVILDLYIPRGMGGKDTIKELLQRDPEARAIVSSGRTDDPVLYNFREHGFLGALVKPFTYEEFKLTLGRVLGVTPG